MAVDIKKQIAAVKKSAEKMNASAPAKVGTASIGDVVRQGDLYLVCIEELPADGRRAPRQLAPGNTQGSRHCAEGECSVYMPKSPAAVAKLIGTACHGAEVPEQLVGPLVECIGETTITHPEHGHRMLPAGSVWVVVFQRAYADEVRRVQD
jgi:hypothetical protein